MKPVKTIQMKCGQAYVVTIDDVKKELLEMGDVFLPNENVKGTRPYRFEDFGEISDANKRVLTICTMVGCCYSCTFCACRRSFKRLLTEDELIGQVDFCIEEGKKYGRSPDPMESKDFHVLYTRMGEPSGNIKNVIGSIYRLAKRYPHIRIGMSTQGIRGKTQEFLKHPAIAPHIMMQFSLHGTDEATREKLLQTPIGKPIMTIEDIAAFAKEFRKMNPRQVSLNIILLKGERYDFQRLKTIFDPEDVYLRLSPLNVTENSAKHGLRGLLREEDVMYKMPYSSDELRGVIEDIKKAGFDYSYAPAIDEEIKYQAACGQALETLRSEGKIPLDTFDEKITPIPELIKSYVPRTRSCAKMASR